MKKPRSPAEAHKMKLKAAKKIKYITESDTSSVLDQFDIERKKADIIASDEYMAPQVDIERGLGGEVVPPDDRNLHGMALTVKKEDAATLEASIERIELADKCGAYNLAFDAAEAAKTQDPIEQMLIHQMAAVHKAAMDTLSKLSMQEDAIKTTKLANSAARLIEVYQKGATTLHKMRKGGKQTVTIQHVNISDNAQAIVGGNINSRGTYEKKD